jgi:hypothetical protein
MVNSGGTSRYSAMTFTPPLDTSVIVQSRGSEPVPNWIFAKLLHRRRSLLRRFINMAIPSRSDDGLSNTPAGLQRNYWNLPSGIVRNVSVLFKFPLPSPSNLPKPAVNGRKAVEKPPRCISMRQLSRMQKCFLTSCVNAGLHFRPGFPGILPSRLMGPASPRLRPNSPWRLSPLCAVGP